jgi:hypothetical protein
MSEARGFRAPFSARKIILGAKKFSKSGIIYSTIWGFTPESDLSSVRLKHVTSHSIRFLIRKNIWTHTSIKICHARSAKRLSTKTWLSTTSNTSTTSKLCGFTQTKEKRRKKHKMIVFLRPSDYIYIN